MLLLILGIVLTAVCWYFAWSHIGLVSEYSFFPLWVGYILLVNGLSEVMAGTSLMRRMRWSFLWLFIVSIPMWWFFEYMNSIVQNWHYLLDHPISILHYEIQASIDFSTVVPAVLSTSTLVFQLLRRHSLNTRVAIRIQHCLLLSCPRSSCFGCSIYFLLKRSRWSGLSQSCFSSRLPIPWEYVRHSFTKLSKEI